MSLISNSPNRSLVVTLSVVVLLSFAGCGEEKKPAGAITGTVKSGETMIGNCSIAMFEPTSMRTLGITVGESGEFSLEDVPFGSYQVRVYPKPTNTVDEIPDPRIPKKVRAFKTSGISISVADTDPVELNINFK